MNGLAAHWGAQPLTRCNCVASLGLCIAHDADDGHAVELSKGVRHVSLKLKLLLAQVAPSLEIIRVAAVLNKPGWGGLSLEHVLTDNGGDSLTVRPAVNHHWLSSCHASCAAYGQGV